MESCPHLKPKIVCAVCCRALDHVPVFYCPQKHSCCQNCYKEVKCSLKGGDSQPACPLCRISGQFTPSRSKIKPGIGRPYRYNVNTTLPVTTYSYSRNYQDICTPSTSSVRQDEEQVFETLIGMSKEKFYKSQTTCAMKNCHHNKKSTKKSRFTALTVTPSSTKRPFKCPHKPCHKTVAVAQFVNHFKSEHKDVLHCPVERGKELLLQCDVTRIEYNFHFCLAMITVYEVNRVDYLKKGSSESVIRTCSKFCQKIPIGTFWLMVSASSEPRSTAAHCLFWLFTNSEEVHKSTIELASVEDTISLSTYCRVSRVLDNDFGSIKRKLQGLIVTKSSLKSLLREGELLNVRITIH